MGRPKKPRVFTLTSVRSRRAVIEGIDHFIAWGNLARTGEVSQAAAHAANQALELFSAGKFTGSIVGVAPWAVFAWANIRSFIQEGHWHLRPCSQCDRWMLVKDSRKRLCRRPDCVRKVKRPQRTAQRKARAALDLGAQKRARTF